ASNRHFHPKPQGRWFKTHPPPLRASKWIAPRDAETYQRVLNAPGLSFRSVAILMLLAHGLLPREVCVVRLEDVDVVGSFVVIRDAAGVRVRWRVPSPPPAPPAQPKHYARRLTSPRRLAVPRTRPSWLHILSPCAPHRHSRCRGRLASSGASRSTKTRARARPAHLVLEQDHQRARLRCHDS